MDNKWMSFNCYCGPVDAFDKDENLLPRAMGSRLTVDHGVTNLAFEVDHICRGDTNSTKLLLKTAGITVMLEDLDRGARQPSPEDQRSVIELITDNQRSLAMTENINKINQY